MRLDDFDDDYDVASLMYADIYFRPSVPRRCAYPHLPKQAIGEQIFLRVVYCFGSRRCYSSTFWNMCRIESTAKVTASPYPLTPAMIRQTSLRPRAIATRSLHDDTSVAGNTLSHCQHYLVRLKDKEQLTGQSSAASLPTGPVMADPFISPFGLTI